MTPNLSSLSNCVSRFSPINIVIANGSPMQVASIGSVIPSLASSFSIPNVFYVPQLSQLSDTGFDAHCRALTYSSRVWFSQAIFLLSTKYFLIVLFVAF